MAGRKFSTAEYLAARCADIEPLFAFDARNLEEARKWRARALAKVRDLLGEMPDWVPPKPEVLERVDAGDHIREKVVFDADANSSVPAYVLIPKRLSPPAPAALCLHGYGPGKDVVVGLADAERCSVRPTKRQSDGPSSDDFARALASRGYVTLAFDFRCFGERSEPGLTCSGQDSCDLLFLRGVLLGISLLTLDVHDTLRALDYLASRPEVDPRRIGCAGQCMGGMVALWAAAVDRRVRSVVMNGCLCEMASLTLPHARVCGAMLLPNLIRSFDSCDVAALIAPRPILVQSGTQNQVCPIDSAVRAFAKLQLAYQAWNAPEKVAHDVFDGEDEFRQQSAIEWFDRWLKPSYESRGRRGQ